MKSKLLTLSSMFITFISFNILALNEPALEIIASEIASRLLSESGALLLNKVIDDSILPPELQEIIQKELVKTFLKLFNLEPEFYSKLINNSSSIELVVSSNSGRSALTKSDDGTAILWDITQNPIEVAKLKDIYAGIICITFCEDDKYILMETVCGAAIFWDIPKQEMQMHAMPGYPAGLAAQFNYNGRNTFARFTGSTIILWLLNPLFKIINQLNMSELVLLNKCNDLSEKDIFNGRFSNIEYQKILEKSAHKRELESYFFGILQKNFEDVF